MTNFEDYLKSLLIENEAENEINNIIGDLFQEATSAEEIGDSNASYIGMNTYFVFDPFPFLVFDNTCNHLSNTMIDYYKQALEDYNKHKGAYRALKILPSFIKGTIQCTAFSKLTRSYVESGFANDIKGIDVIKDFYRLKSDEIGDDFYSNVGSWHKLKSLIETNKGNRLFTPVDMITGAGYRKVDSPNVAYANGIYMQYELKTLPVMNILSNESIKFKNEEGSLSLDKDERPENEYEKYIGYMIAGCAMNNNEIQQEVEKVKSNKSFKSNVAVLNKHFDKENYKNDRLTKQSSDIDYWKDSEIGQSIDWINKNANGDPNSEGAAWAKTVDNLSHTFNRTKLDTDIEKAYNLKHFIPDALGMESSDSRYDARKYEDPNRRKIKGVSGFDVYMHDKKIQDLEDEIDELEKEISMESDLEKVSKLQKHIDDNKEEIDIIKQKLDSEESKGTRTKELYKNKIEKATDSGTSVDSFSKGVKFVKSHSSDLAMLKKYLANQ